MMKFFDSHKQSKALGKQIYSVIRKVINEGNFIMGEEVHEFEAMFAKYIGSRYCLGLNSGTDALYIALVSLGVKPGDEVITTPFTMAANIEAIIRAGAKPVFADIDLDSFNLDAKKAARKITKKTKAIIVVHLFGRAGAMDEFMALAKRHNIKIVEDAAQAAGGKIMGRRLGSIGDTGCFSFFPTKNLGGFGDGGAITTDDENIASLAKALRAHGASRKYIHDHVGLNSRLDTLQAGILKVKLPFLERWNRTRIKKAEIYSSGLKNIKAIKTPRLYYDGRHVYHNYTLRAANRDELRKRLEEKNIPSMVYYPLPLHLQPIMARYGYKSGDFPNAEKACQEVISLPIYPELAIKEQKIIIKNIRDFYKKYV